MKKVLSLLTTVIIIVIATCCLFPPEQTSAADVRADDSITIRPTEQNLHDLYLFGHDISVDSPVTNDLVTAGGTINSNAQVTGSIMAAGGDILIKGPVGNTVRVAGGNIQVNSTMARDLIAAGGNIIVGKDATISGDVLFFGGKLSMQGSVQGKMLVNGGEVFIDGPVKGNVTGEVGKLTLGPHAVINGSLSYSSSEKAVMEGGAVVHGKTTFTQIQPKEERHKSMLGGLFGTFSIYKLLTDIILSILFILFFHRFIHKILVSMTAAPLKSAGVGFIYLLVFPAAAVFCLLLIWLGFAAFLFYGLSLLVGIFIAKIFLGFAVMRWLEKRNNKEYVLDWKAGLVGPIILFILLFIPIIGWIAVAILFFIALGAMLGEFTGIIAGQKREGKTQKAVKK